MVLCHDLIEPRDETDMGAAKLRVDIVSDVVCPWCIIGYKQLEEALKRTGTEIDLHWHPFELNPTMPPEGQNIREHVAEKYGATAEQSARTRAQMKALGDSLGFTFSYDDDSRIVNTFQAHQLLHWANEQGREHELKMALFTRYFTDGGDVSDTDVLLGAVGDVGLDIAEAKAVLANERYAKVVREREAFWTSNGISGVPAMIFNQKHLVTGAQGADNYAAILTQLKQMAAGA